MSYETGQFTVHTFAAASFSTPVVRTIRGPKGRRGRIEDVHINVTTAFVGTSTPGKLQIGDGTTVNKFAEMLMGAASAGTVKDDTVMMSDLASYNKQSDSVYLLADGSVVITPVAPTGGSPAGAADVVVTIRWF